MLVELTARFHRPAGLHDLLKVTTEVVSVGRTASTWRQEMNRDGDVIATLEITAAFTDRNGRPGPRTVGFCRGFGDLRSVLAWHSGRIDNSVTPERRWLP